MNETVMKDIGDHEKQCFIVMPYGKNLEEQRWFRGWYKQVIEMAVKDSGYIPVLSALENKPNAINDEIRVHLSYDAMVVVDLGGFTAENQPNPNVMYELGIRHALNLPLVIMGWKDQPIPFDIGNQRIILEERDFISIPKNIELLKEFIVEASNGNYYKPMDAVGRSGLLERASDELSNDNLLKVLVEEIQDLKGQVEQRKIGRLPRGSRNRSVVKGYLGSKQERKTLCQLFLDKGGDLGAWGKILGTPIDDELYEKTIGWSVTQWREYVLSYAEDRN